MNLNITQKITHLPVKGCLKAKPVTIKPALTPNTIQQPIIIEDSDDEGLSTHKKMITEKKVVDVISSTPKPQKTAIKQEQPKPEDVAVYKGYSLERLQVLEGNLRGQHQKLKNPESLKKIESALASIEAAKEILITKETIKAAERFINAVDLLSVIQPSFIKNPVEMKNCDLEMPEPNNCIKYLPAIMKTVLVAGPGCDLNQIESAKGSQFKIEDVLKHFCVSPL